MITIDQPDAPHSVVIRVSPKVSDMRGVMQVMQLKQMISLMIITTVLICRSLLLENLNKSLCPLARIA